MLAIKGRKERLGSLEHDSKEASDDWKRYEREVLQLIDEYERAGKPTYPLYRALEYKQPELIPAIMKKVQN